MSFDLTVVFTGLVGFVENRCRNSKVRLCALLTDAQPGRQSRFENTALRQHRAFVRFPIWNVSSLSAPSLPFVESSGIWHLNRERLYFEIQESADAPYGVNDFRIRRATFQGAHPEAPSANDFYSYTWALDFARVYQDFVVDPEFLAPRPRVESVTAQVLLERGEVSTKSTTRAVWDYEQRLSGEPYRQAFSHEISVTYRHLSAARLVAVSFDNAAGPRRFLDLTSLERCGQLEIHIINICDCNPLQWAPYPLPVDDEDSKWNFEILSPTRHQAVRDLLRYRPLPIPRVYRILDDDGTSGPGSGNCPPCRLPDAQFWFPELDGPDFRCEV